MKKISRTLVIALSVAPLLFFSHASAAVTVKEPTNLGLVGYWSLDEGTSTIAHDFSGNGNNGTLTNMSIPSTATSGWGNGKHGADLIFDGTNDKVVGSDAALPSGAASRSISFWAYPTLVDGNFHVAFAYGTTVSTESVEILIQQNSNVWMVSQYGLVVTGNVAVPNKWIYITATFDGTTWNLYENGVLTGTGAMTTNTVLSSLCLGNEFTTAGVYFKGGLDEVRVYNRVLSAAEISTIYHSGAAKITTANTTSGTPLVVNTEDNKLTKGLVGLWSFNTADMSGTTAIDRSGQGNNGTFSGTFGTGAGKVGQAILLNADGTSKVSLTSPSSLSGGTAKSMSLWLKASSLRGVEQDIAEFGTDGNLSVFGIDLTAGNFITGHFGGVGDFQSTIVPIVGAWYHVVVTYNAGLCSLYVNGTLVATKSQTANTGTTNFFFGQHLTSGTGYFVGSIDEVRIYNRALSLSEVQELYQTGLVIVNAPQTTRATNGLVGYWPFDGKNTVWSSATAGTVTDSSGNGGTGNPHEHEPDHFTSGG